MTPEHKTKLIAAIYELRDHQQEKDRNIAKILRLVLEVMANPRHEHRAAMYTIVRNLITSLEEQQQP